MVASTRGSARKRTGSKPMMRSASNSSLIFMEAISAAKAEPERPATRIAVISGPNCWTMARVTTVGSIGVAPYFRSWSYDIRATTKPSMKSITPTRGRPSIPTRPIWPSTSRARNSRG